MNSQDLGRKRTSLSLLSFNMLLGVAVHVRVGLRLRLKHEAELIKIARGEMSLSDRCLQQRIFLLTVQHPHKKFVSVFILGSNQISGEVLSFCLPLTYEICQPLCFQPLHLLLYLSELLLPSVHLLFLTQLPILAQKEMMHGNAGQLYMSLRCLKMRLTYYVF